MTVAENIGFPLRMFTNKTAIEIKERVDFVIDRVNLINAHTKKPSEISGGMQKRVAIARAIVNNPKYLFCDELVKYPPEAEETTRHSHGHQARALMVKQPSR